MEERRDLPLTRAYFGELNVSEEILRGSYPVVSKLSDEQLLLLDEHLRNIKRHVWKLRCALFYEVRKRVRARGGTVKALRQVAAEFGIGLSTLYRKAQIWQIFFQDPDSDEVKHRDVSYLFEDFENAEDWFVRALLCSDPVAAIRHAEKRWRETGGKYSPAQLAGELQVVRHADQLDWAPFVILVRRDMLHIIEAGLDDLVEKFHIEEGVRSKAWGLGLTELFKRALPPDKLKC